ncbi:hypothetical protein ANCCAN_23479 [Ancylostoma caninum]|uniref:Uncharacterized protein n=1 Tax=Ancylostoma caninum TaxID=29170 RepID=A0A368FID4_ANCCA|nr:hypothetical protein ANCCAN_23479 [Ancylostoma caninum]
MNHSLQSFTILSTRSRMDPLCVLKVEVWQQKFLGKEWKPYVAAVFAESEFGKARIELFNSPKKVKSMEPNKIILLDQCVSIKIPKKEGKFMGIFSFSICLTLMWHLIFTSL